MDSNGKYPVYGGNGINGINGYHSSYMFENRKIVIGRVGAYCGVVHYTQPFSWVTDNALYIAKKDLRLSDEYLEIALKYSNLNQYSSQSGQPLISEGRLENVKLLIPHIAEQKRIASIAQKCDRLRRTRRYTQQLSDSYLRSVFLEMFGDPVTNPKKWEQITLEELKTDFIYGTSTKCHSEPNGLPVLRIPNVISGGLDLRNLKYAELPEKEIKQLRLQENDVVFVRTNGNLDYVGRCAVFNLEDQYLFASYLIRARFSQKKLNSWFLSAYLQTPLGRQAMEPFREHLKVVKTVKIRVDH